MDWLFAQMSTFTGWAPLIGIAFVVLVGLVGLSSVLKAESRRRRNERFDGALAGVMAALGRRATALEMWSSSDADAGRGSFRTRPQSEPPSDVELQSHLDIASMAAPRRHRATIHLLTNAATLMTRGRVDWQIVRSGDLSRLTRRWRTRVIDRAEYVSQLKAIEVEVRAQERAALHHDTGDHPTEQLAGTAKKVLLL